MARDIEDEITDCLSKIPVSDGDNLLGFEIDLEWALSREEELFVEVSVRRTGDPRCLLNGTCKLLDASVPAGVVVERLKEMWLARLAYEHWETHHCEVLPEQISLRFATATGATSNDICVTGKIIVSGLRP